MRRLCLILFFWVPPVLWAGLIFFLSSRPVLPETGPSFPLKDKVAHAVAYFVLGWLVTHALRRAHDMRLSAACWLGLALAALYGAFDEWHQSFVPPRVPGIGDWLADVFGAAMAQLAHLRHGRAKWVAGVGDVS